jgi:hypothetical protein
MNNVNEPRNKKASRPPKASIRRDGIPAWAYQSLRLTIACEDCTHFKRSDLSCTIGYLTSHHLKAFQEVEYNRTGKVALCRFMEID